MHSMPAMQVNQVMQIVQAMQVMRRCQIWGTIELHRDPISKVLSEWLNSSKHPMLSISMAYNVISCKKVERNTQKLKIADFTM